MKTKEELEVIDADKAYWEELADAIGWKLYGWADRREAGYRHPSADVVIDVNGSFRDAVMEAIGRKNSGKD